ncbi:pyridoxamine 5'-phosphate oxidase family protein [Litorisediminicola beolgyonensis]|uniref:Pyridoxamine 5'-phosphate oxidase family protein n=1 Tax=Litorisediminicola beolgyonensis TaxID=1173614 RepID=A0ABW3ZNI9_9RHOB
MTDPVRPADPEALAIARRLIAEARFAALAVTDPATGLPAISRIGVVPGPGGLPMALVSDLSQHTAALTSAPECALLIGEPGPSGDPLTHPRLSLNARAQFHRHGEPGHAELAAHYVARQPKAKLYIGFGDFSILTFQPRDAFLNGGFGKAFTLTAADLTG